MNFKLKNEIILLPNADKGDWVEKWRMDTHAFDTLVHPFKACLIGRPNSGKTTVMHNLFLRIQMSNKPFQTLLIIQPSTSKEHDILDPTITLFDIPEIESIVSEDNGKTLIIIDDFDISKLDNHQKRNLSMLFRYVSSHHNISVLLSYQSFLIYQQSFERPVITSLFGRRIIQMNWERLQRGLDTIKKYFKAFLVNI